MSTTTDPSYKGIEKVKGVTIWRVENKEGDFGVRKLPKFSAKKEDSNDISTYKGNFFEGDCYIILQNGTKKTEDIHIYFWLGSKSSQDERGTAAIKTVELDDSLGGRAIQHRETQNNETKEFRSMFDYIRYKEGGIASGFRDADQEHVTKLYHVYGNRRPRVAIVEKSNKSVNAGDVFIADGGDVIVQWNGSESDSVEQIKASLVSRHIRDDERGGGSVIHIVDQGKDDDIFWDTLGIDKSSRYVKPAETHVKFGKTAKEAAVKLYKVSHGGNSLKKDMVAQGHLKKDMLKEDSIYLLDAGGRRVYVWVGKMADKEERKYTMQMASDYTGGNDKIPAERVVMNAESASFKSFFDNWLEMDEVDTQSMKKQSKSFVKRMFSAKKMHQKASRAEESQIDDGTGKKEVYRIEDFEPKPVPENKYGQFYSGDSYVIKYVSNPSTTADGKEHTIVYFWQGSNSTKDERGAAALAAKKMDDDMGGTATQIRVTQNHEPRHFRQMFKGTLIIHTGGTASGFKHVKKDGSTSTFEDNYDTDGTYLYRIRGTNAWNVYAFQIPEKASELNSGDAFLLVHKKDATLWFGSKTNQDEKSYAQSLVKTIVGDKDVTKVLEGKEPASFWSALGGKADYPKTKDNGLEYRDARLFHASTTLGYFYCEEEFDFDQSALVSNDCMLLDSWAEIYVWLGAGAEDEEKKKSIELAVKYLDEDSTSRSSENIPIIVIRQMKEPPTFTQHFPGWSKTFWDDQLSVSDLKAAISGADPLTAQDALKSYNVRIVPYADLKGGKCPEGVDPTKKEDYLSEEEFKKYFGMTKGDYEKLPAWKSKKLKQKAKLF